ncbi:alpha,alpha-trehalase TreF [Brucella pseudogrignonensis]|uniref:Alpha,alpha-trehalase n=1 Tax=Brucella pseudogrignonensis TaxID=419475 RepID=A0ABU1M7J5_9HYPH|nr:alpha,alpha-trehalase TreF [Brucella pseudogrignonensis]MDR6431817.1 alpha,alpha-trehalase [Brucella pseudogrignonensis]
MKYTVVPAFLVFLQGGAMAAPQTPDVLYGPLFEAVQLQRVFPDSKSFADAVPNGKPEEIVALYNAQSKLPGFNLTAFVNSHFTLAQDAHKAYASVEGENVCEHIDTLWDYLKREPTNDEALGSLLPLQFPYVVPGGRFREIYYWDSYFTMQGLIASGRVDLAETLLRNLADLATRYGHVPNGNRSYYLSRSQPPFLAAMVELMVSVKGKAEYKKYLPALEAEYAYWMDGSEGLRPGERHRNVVMMPDGAVLNRYWDEKDTPREESYFEDVNTARQSQRASHEVYKNLRAGAESGWDFSSRWLKDPNDLSSIRTIDIVPVDLNALLFQLETTLQTVYALNYETTKSEDMHDRAKARQRAINEYLWNEVDGYFVDYWLDEQKQSRQLTAATVYPLYFRLATLNQGDRTAVAVKDILLKSNGVTTTSLKTGQQWDEPNAWAPLQWLATQGFSYYDHPQLAQDIATRWSQAAVKHYQKTGKLTEKYNVNSTDEKSQAGEYPTQDGFGWTNGVLRAFLAQYPSIVDDNPSCVSKAASHLFKKK